MKILILYSLTVLIFSASAIEDLNIQDHAHDDNVNIHEKQPCPAAMDFVKCGCEFVRIGYVVECENITWTELIEFSAKYAATSNTDNMDYFLYLVNFHGSLPPDFADLPEQSRSKMVLHWKSLSLRHGQNVTQLPDLSWATALEDVFLHDLPNLSLNDSQLRLPATVKQLSLNGVNVKNGSWLTGLRNLSSLELINYGRLDLAELASVLGNLTGLTELSIVQGHLTGLAETTLAGLDALVSLNLSANGLKDLPGSMLRGMIDLAVLDVSYNDLKAIPAGWLEANTELTEFRARWNDIEDIPVKLFDNLHQLAELDLSENYIHSLPGKIFKNTSKLSTLNLRDNNLGKISTGDFTALHNLITMDLGQNLLTALTARTFRGLDRLQHLNLTRNYIQDIQPDAFRDLHSIQQIDLSHNALNVLRNGIFQNIHGNLTFLDLSGNKIHQVEREALAGLNITQLNLTDNALLCSCANIWLKTHLTRETFCVNNIEMTIQNLAELTRDTCTLEDLSFITSSREGIFFAGSIFFLAGVFLLIGVMCVVARRIPAKRVQVFYPSTYYDPENLNGSSDNMEIKTISTSL